MEFSGETPHNCPGVTSETAGKASACKGCPNQTLCSEKKPDDGADKRLLVDRLKDVKKKLLVLSGKGGVGKSTVTSVVSRHVASQLKDKNFGVLDLDICGPSQPRMMGVKDEQVHGSGSGWSPVSVGDNLCLMSVGFLLSAPDDAIIWRGPKKNGLIKQFLSEVDWGCIDCLFIDTPPGTSDEHLSVINFLNMAGADYAAIIVTTPQEISLLDVRKEISFCKRLGIPILGVIENMSQFYCRKCSKTSEVFPCTTGGAKSMCAELQLRFLGSIPLDARIGEFCDNSTDPSVLSEVITSLDDICKEVGLWL